jgi:hypothetical protein
MPRSNTSNVHHGVFIQRRFGQAGESKGTAKFAMEMKIPVAPHGPSSKGLMLGNVELLIAKADHAVIQECLADLAYYSIVQILCHIGASNLRPQRAGDGRISI